MFLHVNSSISILQSIESNKGVFMLVMRRDWMRVQLQMKLCMREILEAIYIVLMYHRFQKDLQYFACFMSSCHL